MDGKSNNHPLGVGTPNVDRHDDIEAPMQPLSNLLDFANGGYGEVQIVSNKRFHPVTVALEFSQGIYLLVEVDRLVEDIELIRLDIRVRDLSPEQASFLGHDDGSIEILCLLGPRSGAICRVYESECDHVSGAACLCDCESRDDAVGIKISESSSSVLSYITLNLETAIPDRRSVEQQLTLTSYCIRMRDDPVGELNNVTDARITWHSISTSPGPAASKPVDQPRFPSSQFLLGRSRLRQHYAVYYVLYVLETLYGHS